MSTPSTYLDRRLVVDRTVTLRRLPEGWPNRTGGSLLVDPPVTCEPGKKYRVRLNVEAGTATITEEAPNA